MRESKELPISMARFANVAFSDGSLLHGFRQRLIKNHPYQLQKISKDILLVLRNQDSFVYSLHFKEKIEIFIFRS